MVGKKLTRKRKLFQNYKTKKYIQKGSSNTDSSLSIPGNSSLFPPPPILVEGRRPPKKSVIKKSINTPDFLKDQAELHEYVSQESDLASDFERLAESKVASNLCDTKYQTKQSYIINNPKVLQEVIKIRTDAKLVRLVLTKRKELVAILGSLSEDSIFHQEYNKTRLSLAARLELGADEEDDPNMSGKRIRLKIQIICILQNIIDYQKFIQYLEQPGDITSTSLSVPSRTGAISSSAGMSGSTYMRFFMGKRSEDIEYLGTNHEESTRIEKIDGKYHILIHNDNQRDIFMCKINYKTLANEDKTQLPFYKSSGTSYSGFQKGFLSPFNGKALNIIPYSEHGGRCETNDFYKLILEFANFIFPKLFSIKFGLDVSGRVGNVLFYTPEEWKKIFEEDKVYSIWYIKFNVLYHFSNKSFKSLASPNYESWPNYTSIQNLLGNTYFQKQAKKGNLLGSENLFILKDISEPLRIIENRGKKLTGPEILAQKEVFFNRFFGNEDFFSYRNMGNNILEKQDIRDYELNEKIKDHNIFGKNIHEEGKKQSDDRIDKKIMAYIYDSLYHCINPNDCIADINYVLELADKEIRLEIKQVNSGRGENFVMCVDKMIVGEIVKVLKEVAPKIIDGTGEEYKNTIFYNIMKLPFYFDIEKPPTS